jgi:hypothetical protein
VADGFCASLTCENLSEDQQRSHPITEVGSSPVAAPVDGLLQPESRPLLTKVLFSPHLETRPARLPNNCLPTRQRSHKALLNTHTTTGQATMPTNRPFLSNFLAAFRAHSAISQASTATPTSSQTPQQPSHHTATSHPTANPRTITSKSLAAGPTTTAVQTLQTTRTTQQTSTSPLSRSPGTPTAGHIGGSSRRRRRSSSSSTEGFRDALGGEKWWIGGRSAGGEERFYRLGTVRRHRSIDRLSMDELSL